MQYTRKIKRSIKDSIPYLISDDIKKESYKNIIFIHNNKDDIKNFQKFFEFLMPHKYKISSLIHNKFLIYETDNDETKYFDDSIKTLINISNSSNNLILLDIGSVKRRYRQIKEFKNIIELKVDSQFPLNAESLTSYGFERVDTVRIAHEFAIRGEIVDFSLCDNGINKGYRIILHDNKIEAIKVFDLHSQVSYNEIKNVDMHPVISGKNDLNYNIFEILHPDGIYITAEALEEVDENNIITDLDDIVVSKEELKSSIQAIEVINITPFSI